MAYIQRKCQWFLQEIRTGRKAPIKCTMGEYPKKPRQIKLNGTKQNVHPTGTGEKQYARFGFITVVVYFESTKMLLLPNRSY